MKSSLLWRSVVCPTKCGSSLRRLAAYSVVSMTLLASSPGATSEQSTWLRPCESFQPSATKAVYDDLKRKADSGDQDAAYEWTRIAKLDDHSQYLDLKARDEMLDRLAAQGHKGAIAKTLRRTITTGELVLLGRKGGEVADDT